MQDIFDISNSFPKASLKSKVLIKKPPCIEKRYLPPNNLCKTITLKCLLTKNTKKKPKQLTYKYIFFYLLHVYLKYKQNSVNRCIMVKVIHFLLIVPFSSLSSL